ncbi:MAG: cytochrome P460 family protein [Pseudomonadota bacterium]
MLREVLSASFVIEIPSSSQSAIITTNWGMYELAAQVSVDKWRLHDSTRRRARIKDKLLLIAVMEKRGEFGGSSASPIATGDWYFAAHKPNSEIALKNPEERRACHSPLTATDFVFSTEHLLITQ